MFVRKAAKQSYCTTWNVADCIFSLLVSVISMSLCTTGVAAEWRRQGIGSHLMKHLMDYVLMKTKCKAIYLHVEVENQSAIDFYTHKEFTRFCRVPGYYTINGLPVDGFLYILFCNGGQRYSGRFLSWCRRYVMDSSVCQCFSDLVHDVGSSMKSVWKKDKQKE